MSMKPLIQRALAGAALANSSNAKENLLVSTEDDQWSPAALERAGSALKALNRMAKRPPVHILFEDVGFTVKTRKSECQVLHNVSGEFRSGELACILGPSGAGKSTLLNILTGYINDGMSGRITVNGHVRDMNVFKKLSSYIMQDDLLQPWLTVRESMEYVADLKLRKDLGKAEKDLIVEEILQTLGLWAHRETVTQNLSGGQTKRLSVALELVNNPPVIFLDEPTTGLDVVSVRQLVVLLRLLSRQGRTIICTIHQPSASLFSLFDRVYILAQGLCCYQGAAPLLVPFLAETGYVCPTTHNPADFVLETLSGNEEAVLLMSDLCKNGKTCREQSVVRGRKKHMLHSEESVRKIFVKHVEKEQLHKIEYATTFTVQFWTLLRRISLQMRRDITWLYILIMHHVFSAVITGSIFFSVGKQADMPIANAKFCLCVEVFFVYSYAIVPILLYPREMRALIREHFNRWYSLKAYYVARTVSTLPFTLICSMIFLSISYLMSGQPLELSRFVLFSVCGILTAVCSEGLGLMIGSILSTTNGAIMGPAVVSPLLLIACYGMGFGSQIEGIMRFLMQLSFIRFSFTGQSLALYLKREKLQCEKELCIYSDTHLFLRDLGMINDSYIVQLIGITVYLILFRTCMYFALKYRLTRESKSKVVIFISKVLKCLG